ncbi:malate dehydrogenase (quinone) [Nocardia sp. SYP-A9097]|uniref:malate dehydrogenase (quinone) n=1 Tax=Nocardia sp. SYP-A9097 TaxID=2663237 RepID=UPI00129AFA7A|nr:malate dehydrogenase (quinone) [Nocardia sp. SYP-A9097]MRH87047.1 malate dehydrogenase (quinone) [Nocardia sp. SYP-A9097]
MNTRTALRPYDVVLVGGGIMSATLGILLKHVEPTWSIAVYERLPELAAEASAPWHNAGTGHSGLCELNYTSETADGGIDIAKAVAVNEHFQQSRQLWASLVEAEILGKPDTFINPVPHMTLVHGTDDVDHLRRRHETLSAHPLFSAMRFSTESKLIEGWAPLLTERRGLYEPFAATRDVTGSDVDFGSLTRQLFAHLEASGVEIHRRCEVRGMRKNNDGSWQLRIHQFTDNDRLTRWVDSRFVFAGAGGWALKLLQNAGLPQVQGYGLLPVSGRFLRCDNPAIVERHDAKVYGKAKVGAPPMSMPHLDTRVVDGKRALLFGPYPGANPKFLKQGSVLDAPASLRSHNVGPLASMIKENPGLIWLLLSQVTATRGRKMSALREFAPAAAPGDWSLISAGQRAQIVKRDASGRGALQFGTEVVASSDGTIAAVLGASPGASTAPAILLDVLERCFPRYRGLWAEPLRELIPTLGLSLATDMRLARQTMSRTAEILGLVAPDNLS